MMAAAWTPVRIFCPYIEPEMSISSVMVVSGEDSTLRCSNTRKSRSLPSAGAARHTSSSSSAPLRCRRVVHCWATGRKKNALRIRATRPRSGGVQLALDSTVSSGWSVTNFGGLLPSSGIFRAPVVSMFIPESASSETSPARCAFSFTAEGSSFLLPGPCGSLSGEGQTVMTSPPFWSHCLMASLTAWGRSAKGIAALPAACASFSFLARSVISCLVLGSSRSRAIASSSVSRMSRCPPEYESDRSRHHCISVARSTDASSACPLYWVGHFTPAMTELILSSRSGPYSFGACSWTCGHMYSRPFSKYPAKPGNSFEVSCSIRMSSNRLWRVPATASGSRCVGFSSADSDASLYSAWDASCSANPVVMSMPSPSAIFLSRIAIGETEMSRSS